MNSVISCLIMRSICMVSWLVIFKGIYQHSLTIDNSLLNEVTITRNFLKHQYFPPNRLVHRVIVFFSLWCILYLNFLRATQSAYLEKQITRTPGLCSVFLVFSRVKVARLFLCFCTCCFGYFMFFVVCLVISYNISPH